ncbi:Tol-Pal system beta propeller repeat protein TolB [Cognatazoarcus halotolerans]|uniref:Tol-Pal system beta propeller repeat protein TolB n=1 Tax=Cognatazoarcus halotolerans TaxID=2686016 RepID=UPI001356ED57|nr:Tol-Pal system beta propeller repeat protein TolB [Cognatazoarcus halotolerans]MBX3680180.1 Tol-Pal system protein TolB [Rhodocyclaceae bacterium]MCB1902419.1 Tol-Pal system protein TolB [Rhodocyclaceae bacterium]MCP5307850.1 Tol-Pal system protein TolB [Zoogloeaceae bacterium]
MKHTLLARYIVGFVLVALALSARAQLAIEISGAGANRIPVAIAAFEGENGLAGPISEVVRGDLAHSGLFNMVEVGSQPMSAATLPDLADIRGRGADAVLVGSVVPIDGGRFEVRFRLFDTQRQAELGALALRMTSQQNRATGHRIADFVFEKLTGLRGVFSTRIAYVVKSAGRYQLQIADADGMNAQTALASREPIISPAWSPDGSKLAYVSFEAKKPVVYVHSLATGLRNVAANFKGSNSAPAWSPDGRQLAVVLTKDGQSQLYTVNADGSGVRRIASSSGIDTEPAWSADGKWIYFTSDRGGSPQIYRIQAGGGGVERITFDGGYNVTPRPSPDGRSLTFVTRNNGRFQVAIMDLASRQVQILTDGSRDESPSFAPNGQMILYATESGGRGVLAAVSADGRIKQRLSVQAADVREPAWGPLPR